MSQSRPKVLGPEPRSPPLESTSLETPRVAEKEGRTSLFSILKVLLITSPSLPWVVEIVGLTRKMSEIIPRTIGKNVGLRKKFALAFGKSGAVLKKCLSIFQK